MTSLLKLEKLSSWDVVYAFGMAAACLVTYCIMTSVFSKLPVWSKTGKKCQSRFSIANARGSENKD